MTKEELEVNIAALELLVSETADKSTDFKAQLEKAKQDLANINKPELTPSQLDDVYEAIEEGISTLISVILIIMIKNSVSITMVEYTLKT